MLTKPPRETAEQIINTIASVQATLSDGFQVNDFLSLFAALSAGSPAFAELGSATTEERGQIAGEMFDLLTGTDESALFANFVPGLDPLEEEEVLDLIKKIIVAKIAA